jgi:hypothetical protein
MFSTEVEQKKETLIYVPHISAVRLMVSEIIKQQELCANFYINSQQRPWEVPVLPCPNEGSLICL